MAKKSTQKAKSGGSIVQDLITVNEAAKMRGVTKTAIWNLIYRGRLKTERLFERVLVYRSEVQDFEPEKPGPKKAAK